MKPWTNLLTGWAHLKLVEKANEEIVAASRSAEQGKTKGGIAVAIERLESNLNK